MISIILPIRNEANFIRQSLDAILAQDAPMDQIEILVADGMSTDGTREIVEEYQKNQPNIHLVDNPGKIVPKGINAALRHAKGDIVIRVDGHTLIAPDYVRKCVDTLNRTKADNVGGCMSAIGTTAFGRAVALATSTPFGIGNSQFHYSQNEVETDSVYMGAWPKNVFKRIGLFDEELVRDQDDEFNYRLREYGGKIVLNPEIRSIYSTRSTPKSLWKQYFQYGFYKVRVLQKHPRQMSLRQFVPPVFVLSLLGSIIVSLFNRWGVWLLALTAGSYLLANLAASVNIAARKGWRHLLVLPAAFAIIHLSYGLGFIAGLFKFWNRWGDKIGKVQSLNLFQDDNKKVYNVSIDETK